MRSANPARVAQPSQAANAMPATPRGSNPQDSQVAISTIIRVASAANLSRAMTPSRSPRFQASIGPKPARIIKGVISGTKVALKKGAPTETLPRSNTSRNSG
jgi:hypothetical protein